MIDIHLLAAVINGILLIIVFLLGMLLIRNASIYNYAVGDDDRQTVLKYRILKQIVAIAGLALAATIFNFLVL